MSKHDDGKRGTSRRNLIKYMTFAGAALGLPRWKVFEVMERSQGKAFAAEAACSPTNRSVHIVAGNGGFAWFQLLWPHVDVAAAMNANFAFHAPGQDTAAPGTDKPLRLGPQAPWKNLAGQRQVSAFMAGSNETHTNTPTTSSTVAANTGLFAVCAAIQSVNPTLIPVIAVGNAPAGAANGAPRVSRVNSPDAIVQLFNSAASRAGGALEIPADATVFDANYKGLLALNAAANRPAMIAPFATGKSASGLLGRNLASLLAPSAADMGRYGINAGTQTKIADIGKTLMITAKAFKMGLTSSVILPAMGDDPHGAFANMQNLVQTVTQLGKVLDAFMVDLAATPDPSCTGSTLADTLVLSIHGDTPKDPLNRGGWPDGTPGNSNWIYALGAGWLRSGWHGGVLRNGTTQGFDPATGNTANRSAASTAMAASAAIAYAVTKGDALRVKDFYNGESYSGIVRPNQL
jgi:hypothetical protein